MSKYGVSYYKQKIGLPPHPALAKTSCKTIFSKISCRDRVLAICILVVVQANQDLHLT